MVPVAWIRIGRSVVAASLTRMNDSLVCTGSARTGEASS